jgi:hypothetical protein
MPRRMPVNLNNIRFGTVVFGPHPPPSAPKRRQRNQRRPWPFLACLLLLSGDPSFGAEKYSIAEGAGLVVVGRLTNFTSVRRAGEWHFTGTIVTEEILFGSLTASRDLSYRFACSCCPSPRQPPMQALAKERGLWFLIRVDGSEAWESAGSCSDPGFRPLTYLEDIRKFLRFRGSAKPR